MVKVPETVRGNCGNKVYIKKKKSGSVTYNYNVNPLNVRYKGAKEILIYKSAVKHLYIVHEGHHGPNFTHCGRNTQIKKKTSAGSLQNNSPFCIYKKNTL